MGSVDVRCVGMGCVIDEIAKFTLLRPCTECVCTCTCTYHYGGYMYVHVCNMDGYCVCGCIIHICCTHVILTHKDDLQITDYIWHTHVPSGTHCVHIMMLTRTCTCSSTPKNGQG